MIKALSAIAGATAIAAVITFFSPGFTPEVEAGQSSSVAKIEAPVPQTVAVDARCANQAWPNIDAACLRGSGNATIQPVRVVTTDRR